MKSDTLPELPLLPSHDEHFMTCAHVYTADQMRAYALQARAQLQGEPVAWKYQPQYGLKHPAFTEHEAIAIAHGKDGSVVPLYTTPQPTQATQTDVTNEQILEIAEPFGEFQYGDAQGHKRIDFARAILALRPEKVPMTEDQVWHNDALMSANGTAGFKMDALMRIVRAVEAHHGIKPKEQA